MKKLALLVATAALSVGAVAQSASAAELPAAGIDAHVAKMAHHHHHRHHRHHHHVRHR